jgi:peptidoglycan DL-endopeptidase CwlO
MNRSRKTIARVLVVATAVAVVPAMNPSSVGATPVEDQRDEVQRIADELERLEQESDILAEDHVTAIDEKNQLDAQVADAEEDVAAKAAEVDELRGELSEVAVRAFTSSGTDALGPMFSDSSQYTEGLQRDQLSRVALSTGTATTDELDQAVAELEAERSNLEDMRAAAAEQARRVEAAKSANEERKVEYESARAEAEDKLGRLIQEEEERRARESYERMQREAEEAAAAAAAEQAAAAAAAQQQAAEQQAAEQQQASSTTAAAPATSNGDGGDDGDGGGDGGGGGGGESVVAAARAPQAPAPEPEREPEREPEPASYPQASSRAGTAVNAAMSQLGVPYRFAAAEPGEAFDCSGLTSWAWGQAGVYLPHQSRQQYNTVPHVPSSAAQPGDLIFFYSPISHVSIYLGGGQQVHAPNSGTTVKVGTVNWGNVTGVGRPG